jgi:hypothetical protein
MIFYYTKLQLHRYNSCISGSRYFIIFLYFVHLRQKLNSLQRYDIAQNYRILHRFFSVYHNITSKFRTIAVFKNCVKENNDSNKTYRYVNDLLLCQSSFVYVQRFMSCLHKTNYEF